MPHGDQEQQDPEVGKGLPPEELIKALDGSELGAALRLISGEDPEDISFGVSEQVKRMADEVRGDEGREQRIKDLIQTRMDGLHASELGNTGAPGSTSPDGQRAIQQTQELGDVIRGLQEGPNPRPPEGR